MAIMGSTADRSFRGGMQTSGSGGMSAKADTFIYRPMTSSTLALSPNDEGRFAQPFASPEITETKLATSARAIVPAWKCIGLPAPEALLYRACH